MNLRLQLPISTDRRQTSSAGSLDSQPTNNKSTKCYRRTASKLETMNSLLADSQEPRECTSCSHDVTLNCFFSADVITASYCQKGASLVPNLCYCEAQRRVAVLTWGELWVERSTEDFTVHMLSEISSPSRNDIRLSLSGTLPRWLSISSRQDSTI